MVPALMISRKWKSLVMITPIPLLEGWVLNGWVGWWVGGEWEGDGWMGGKDMLIMCCPSKCLCSYVYVSEYMYACVTESVSFVCTNHTEKANSLTEWGPLSLSLSLFSIQLLCAT